MFAAVGAGWVMSACSHRLQVTFFGWEEPKPKVKAGAGAAIRAWR